MKNEQKIDKSEEQLDQVLKSATVYCKSKSFDVFQMLESVEHIKQTKIKTPETENISFHLKHKDNNESKETQLMMQCIANNYDEHAEMLLNYLLRERNELLAEVDDAQQNNAISKTYQIILYNTHIFLLHSITH